MVLADNQKAVCTDANYFLGYSASIDGYCCMHKETFACGKDSLISCPQGSTFNYKTGECGYSSSPRLDEGQGCYYRIGNYTDVPTLGCLTLIVKRIVLVAFMFLQALAVLFVLVGSLRYVTSRGDVKAVQEAQRTIVYALIGAALVLGSFVLLNFIFTLLGKESLFSSFSFYLDFRD